MNTNKRLSLAILSLSILTTMTGATIIPILGSIKNDFLGISNIYFKLILTLPMIMLIPTTLISNKLASRFGKKRILIIGLVLYAIGGAGAGAASSIYIIMFLRCVIGVGLGLIIPISTSSIAEFYRGDHRLKMMGYASAVASLGGILSPLLSGFFASFSWRYSFGVYLISLLVLVLIILFFEDKKPDKVHGKKPSKPRSKEALYDVYRLAFCMFLMSVIFFALPSNLSLFLAKYNIGNTGLSSILVFLLNGSSFVAGVTLSRISSTLKRFKDIFSYILMGMGFTIMSYSVGTISIIFGIAAIGISVGILTPTYMLNSTKIVPKEQRGYAIAIVSSSMYLGQFVSPLFSLLIEQVIGYSNVKLPFLISAILSFMVVIFNLGILSAKHSNTKELNKQL